MSIKHVSLAEANGHLAELIEAAQRGDEVVIEDQGKIQVKLVVVTPGRKPRVFGQHEGMIWMSPDFNDPLPDDFWLGGRP